MMTKPSEHVHMSMCLCVEVERKIRNDTVVCHSEWHLGECACQGKGEKKESTKNM